MACNHEFPNDTLQKNDVDKHCGDAHGPKSERNKGARHKEAVEKMNARPADILFMIATTYVGSRPPVPCN